MIFSTDLIFISNLLSTTC